MKKLNTTLLQALLDTEFSVLSTSNHLCKNVSLDVLELTKNLKQTIRLLQFIRTNSKNRLQICTTNKQYFNLLNDYICSEKFATQITVLNTLEKQKKTANISQLLLLLDEPLMNNKKIFKRLSEDNIYLVNKINSKIERNNWSAYKIYNELSDFKKVIFLIVLIRQIL